jgi:ABC-type antimicrobial peptide transport system permease subunit
VWYQEPKWRKRLAVEAEMHLVLPPAQMVAVPDTESRRQFLRRVAKQSANGNGVAKAAR